MKRTHPPAFLGGLLVLALLALALAGCRGEPELRPDLPQMPGGDAERGELLIMSYGCDACHSIPGIPTANAQVGPPLDNWAERHYIAGSLANTPSNLILWLRDPQDVEPGTVMPDLDVGEQDARDIGAYLFTLSRERDTNIFGGMSD